MFQDKLTKEIAAAAAQIKTEPPKNEVNTKSVEGAVVSIMANEELKGNQHKIDANKNGKVDAHDFKLLRGKKDMKKEEVEQLDEVGDTPAGRKTLGSYVNKAIADKSKDRTKGLRKATSRMYKDNYYGKKTNEEVEQMDEAFPTVADAKKRMAAKESPFEKKKISTGTVYTRKYKEEPDEDLKSPSRRARDSSAVLGKGEHMAKKKKMSEMLDLYINHGVESLVENLMIEEPSQDEYKKEVEVAQAKSEGKIRNDKGVAKPASQGVRMEEVEQIDELSKGTLGSYVKKASDDATKSASGSTSFAFRSSAAKNPRVKAAASKYSDEEHARKEKRLAGIGKAVTRLSKEEVELEMYDADEINNVQIDNIEERSMTSAEMNKREEIVKSMKKGIQGFKDRYGKDAKSVMYATATKNAMKD